MHRWLALALLVSGCTTTGVTRTQDPLDCVRFVAHPGDHHGFSGAGRTRAFLAGGDALTLWAAKPIRASATAADSLALYAQPLSYGEEQRPVVVPLSALRGTERRWTPLGRWADSSAYLLGMAGAIGAAALLADDREGVSAKEALGLFGGTAVGMALGFGLPYTYRRVSRCSVGP